MTGLRQNSFSKLYDSFELSAQIMLPLYVSETYFGYRAFKRCLLGQAFSIYTVLNYLHTEECLVYSKMLNQLTFEIENKLEREQNNLDLLKERVERSGQLTKNMVGILNSFEERLSKLEETILPVYNETGNLQRRQQNIEKTLAALDTVINYYTVSQEVDSIIRSGPSHSADGLANLDPFLKAMEKLQTAQEYFEKHNPQSVELENVTTLFNDGGLALSREFKDLLCRYSKPVPPMVLLDLLGNDEDTSNEDTPPSLHHFPDNISEELIRIAEWLITHNRDEYMNVYAKVRETVLENSMKQLKDQQRNASGGSMQNVQGILGSPLVKPKFQGAQRKVSKRLQHALEKRANKMLLKASQTLEHSTGLTLGNRRPTLLSEPREDLVEEQEMENYLVTVMALQKLIQSERNLMVGIIPLQHQHKIFEIIIKGSMDNIVQDGENIAARAKKCINRHDFAAVLIIFPILKQLLNMKPEFDKTVQGCDPTVQKKYLTILNTLHSTGAKALEDFIESVRNDTNSQLPKDGTVHELTSNVLVFLEQLTEYIDTIARVLLKDPVYSNPLSRLNCTNKEKAVIGIYIKKVLAQLNSTLMSKSDIYPDVYLRAIFKLNNNHHILKSLQRSELLDLLKSSEPDCEKNYFDMIQDNKKKYMQSWGKVLNHIWNTEDQSQFQLGKLKDKDRYIIKEKFAGFNKEIEEISKIQHGYSIPDVELRESLKRDNKELILPKYNAFYERYSNVNFSKNPEKYIKYSPAQVSALIDRFFDVAA